MGNVFGNQFDRPKAPEHWSEEGRRYHLQLMTLFERLFSRTATDRVWASIGSKVFPVGVIVQLLADYDANELYAGTWNVLSIDGAVKTWTRVS